MNWGEDYTAAGNGIAHLLVSRKGISILQVNIAGGWETAVDNGIRTGIFNYGSCCRMFILSKRSQLGTGLRNYFSFKCMQEPLL